MIAYPICVVLTEQNWKTIAPGWLQAGIAAVAAILIYIQVKEIAEQAKENIEWERKKATFDAVNASHNLELLKQIRVIETKNQDKSKLELFNSNEMHYRNHVIAFMNVFENLCGAIKHNLCDEEIAYDLQRSQIVNYFDQFKECIEWRRKNGGSRTNYLIWEELANKWKKRYENETKSAHSVSPRTGRH